LSWQPPGEKRKPGPDSDGIFKAAAAAAAVAAAVAHAVDPDI